MDLQRSLRSKRDSNPRYPFGVYKLSRFASSATRASLLGFPSAKLAIFADMTIKISKFL